MKKSVMCMIAAFMTFLLIACSDSQTHDGEAKTPSASGAQKGRDYQSVVEDFEERGFTNISLVALDDLITGWLTKDGEVENVSVDGDENYSADKWYSNDVEVIITYHTFSEESDLEEDEESKESISEKAEDKAVESILTIETCADLEKLLSTEGEINDFYSTFAEQYKGSTIVFDGCITYITNHGDYDTRYDILMSGGNYVDDEMVNPGPIFKFEDVNTYGMGIEDLYLPDYISVGSNVHVTAEVEYFSENEGVFYLNPVKVESR